MRTPGGHLPDLCHAVPAASPSWRCGLHNWPINGSYNGQGCTRMRSKMFKVMVGLLPTVAVAGLAVYYAGNANAAVVESASVQACRTQDTSATITAQGDNTGTDTPLALVTLTNVSQNKCQVDGRAFVSLVNAANETVSVPTESVDQPGPADVIVLKPKASAYEGIKWRPCDKAEASCGVGNGLRFNLEASTDGSDATLEAFPAPEGSNITMSWLKIGTLQPSRQSVVAW